MFAVALQFQIGPEAWDDFMVLVKTHAASSRTDEPGCLRYDVCTDPKKVGDVFLYQVYKNEAAFGKHLATPHFLAFDEANTGMVLHKQMRTYREVSG